MDVTFLVTNGGPHPADKWAALASSKIADLVQVDELSDSDAAAVARKAKPRFALDMADALEPIFGAVTSEEEAKITNGTVTARNAPFDVDGHLDSAVNAVVAATQGGPFAAHFSLPEVQAVVRSILKTYFLDSANIQRSWAFDAKGL